MRLADKCPMVSQHSLSPFLSSHGAETAAAGEEKRCPAVASPVGQALPAQPKDLGHAGAETDVRTIQNVFAGFGC